METRNSHLVLALSLSVTDRIPCLQGVGEFDVEVTLVLRVGLVLENSTDRLLFLNSQDIPEIENGLLPVSILGVRTSGESDGLVASSELNIEPRDDGVDEVVTLDGKRVWDFEGQVCWCDCVQIQGEHGAGVRDNSLHFNSIDKGLGEGDVLHGAVVKSINVVPNCDELLVLSFAFVVL